MLTQYCPNCNAEDEWHFYHGYCEPDGMQIEPDTGNCDRCGFGYYQHCKDPLENQLQRFKDKQNVDTTPTK